MLLLRVTGTASASASASASDNKYYQYLEKQIFTTTKFAPSLSAFVSLIDGGTSHGKMATAKCIIHSHQGSDDDTNIKENTKKKEICTLMT